MSDRYVEKVTLFDNDKFTKWATIGVKSGEIMISSEDDRLIIVDSSNKVLLDVRAKFDGEDVAILEATKW